MQSDQLLGLGGLVLTYFNMARAWHHSYTQGLEVQAPAPPGFLIWALEQGL